MSLPKNDLNSKIWGVKITSSLFLKMCIRDRYEGYPLSTALARPLIAQKIIDLAKKEGATAIAHGCTAVSYTHLIKRN